MFDTSRHDNLFNRMRFGQTRVDVIGAGAVGSWAVLAMAQLGVENIHIWDGDIVEAHNLPNQYHFPNNVGQPKVDALKQSVEEKTGMVITPHNERITKKVALGPIVYVCVDKMADRWTIWETCIRRNIRIKMMVETRMGVEEYRIYRVKPTDRNHIAGWESEWYPDSDVEPASAGVCQAQVTVGTTAMMLGAQAAHQLILWFAAETSGNPMLDGEEQLVMVNPLIGNHNSFAGAASVAA